MSQAVEQIKDRLSITDVVGAYVRLERAGNNFRARCPFHNEKTPSFFVSPSRGTYRCFGCGKGGDVFSFVEEIEGLTFKEALLRLAQQAGVTLEKKEFSREDYERGIMRKMHEEATTFYEDALAHDTDATLYLQKRGVLPETVKAFRIGKSGTAWSSLSDHLLARGYKECDLIGGGLSLKGTRGLYDRFRGRIMFPIRDAEGRTVAFSGRVFDTMPGMTDPAKYVNSPETPIYSKSNILFGYDMAKRALMQRDRAIIVEGQMDLVMAHQAGTTNAVATSGTALTEQHLRLIKRFTENVVFSFDADDAGLKASERSVAIALSLGMNVEMLSLPSGNDPADLVRDNKDAWIDATEHPKHIIDFLLDAILAQRLSPRERISAVTKRVLPYIASIGNMIERAHFVHRTAETLAVPEEAIREELARMTLGAGEHLATPVHAVDSRKKRYQIVEEELLGYLMSLEDTPESARARREYERIRGKPYDDVVRAIAQDRKDLIAFIQEARSSSPPPGYVDDLLRQFEIALLKEKRLRAGRLLKKAEREGDKEGIAHLLKLSDDLVKSIERITHRA